MLVDFYLLPPRFRAVSDPHGVWHDSAGVGG